MIPQIDILNWYENAPWGMDAQVEQDLVLSRALVELYSHPTIQRTLAFRGGTALQKLFFNKQLRYSEDLDFVQIESGGIGEILDALRDTLDPWLGKPKRKQNFGRVTLLYKFDTEIEPISTIVDRCQKALKYSDCAVYDIHEYLRNLLGAFEEYYFEQIYLYKGEPRGPYDL